MWMGCIRCATLLDDGLGMSEDQLCGPCLTQTLESHVDHGECALCGCRLAEDGDCLCVLCAEAHRPAVINLITEGDLRVWPEQKQTWSGSLRPTGRVAVSFLRGSDAYVPELDYQSVLSPGGPPAEFLAACPNDGPWSPPDAPVEYVWRAAGLWWSTRVELTPTQFSIGFLAYAGWVAGEARMQRNRQTEHSRRAQEDVLIADANAIEAARRRNSQVARARAVVEGGVGQSRRQPIPRDVRYAVFSRDGGRCVECDANFDIQYDHIIPVAMGGADTVDNLQILCGGCNRAKGATLG